MSFRIRRAPLALAAGLAVLALCPAIAQAQFQVGLQDGTTLSGVARPPVEAQGYGAMSTIGGTYSRFTLHWSLTAGPTPFNQLNPSDPHYNWTNTDEALRRAVAHHITPMLMIYGAPTWAEGPGLPANDPNVGPGSWEPNATLFGQFVHAVAQRYSGNFPDPLHPGETLPRVKYFQLWDEPNLAAYISGPDQVGLFRNLENAGYTAIKSVHSNNVAVEGGLAPVATTTAPYHLHPLTFERSLLCLRQVGNHFGRIKGCPKVNIDIFGVHPYTLAATPTKPPINPNDILVQDVYKLHNLIVAAKKLHTVSRGAHPLWVTEWSWFTNPPQTLYGNPLSDSARYVAESMYTFWKAGVSLVIWQALMDNPQSASTGGGLEDSNGVPKPTMTAFGFPFYASVKGRKGYAWGRTPLRHASKVYVERAVKGQWRRVATVKTDSYGVFQAHFKARGNATYRAQVAPGPVSLPYFSAKIPPRRTSAYNFGEPARSRVRGMGFLDTLTGRRKLDQPAPDRLFAISTAYVTFEASLEITSRGAAAIVFQSLATADFNSIVHDMEEVVRATAGDSGTKVETSQDEFGFSWLVLRGPSFDDLVVGINAVSEALQDGGYGERVLCAVFSFHDARGGQIYWIYNYKRGSFYPFVPASGPQQRDTERELVLKAQVGNELPVENELSRWFPMWGVPI